MVIYYGLQSSYVFLNNPKTYNKLKTKKSLVFFLNTYFLLNQLSNKHIVFIINNKFLFVCRNIVPEIIDCRNKINKSTLLKNYVEQILLFFHKYHKCIKVNIHSYCFKFIFKIKKNYTINSELITVDSGILFSKQCSFI